MAPVEPMASKCTEADLQARILIRASEPVLRSWLGVSRLDQALIGTLYLRQRAILEQWQVIDGQNDLSHKQLVEQLAMAIYLTATAWQTGARPGVGLLASLREIVADGLSAPGELAAGSEGRA